MLVEGQMLSEKCESLSAKIVSQKKEIIRLRYEAQGLHFRKSELKEKCWKMELEKECASKHTKDLGEKLQVLKDQVQHLEGELEGARCGVCLVRISDTALSCGHLFCQGCLLEWERECRMVLHRSMTCPMCRVTSEFNVAIYHAKS